MQLLLRILGHFHPQQLRNRTNAKDPSYEEVVIPTRLANFPVGFRGLTGLLKPNQDMANLVSLELARGGKGAGLRSVYRAKDRGGPLADCFG